MPVSYKGLLGALGLALAGLMPAVHAEDKTLRLYNWADISPKTR